MRFDELASSAGKTAADIGRRAGRPTFGHVLAARRRVLITGWAAATVVVVFIVGVALLWPGPGAPSLGPAGTTATAPPLTASTSPAPSTTTIPVEDTVADLLPGGREACPVTLPGDSPFTPAADTPDGPPPSYESVWFGTPALWTRVNHDGEVWDNLPVDADGSLIQKTFWWREGYSMTDEGLPDITVTLEHLNGLAPTVEAGGPGTSGGHPDLGEFMLVGIEIPQPGCWKITAEYQGTTLSYVAWADTR